MKGKGKSFPSHMAHWATLISVSSALGQAQCFDGVCWAAEKGKKSCSDSLEK